MMDVNILGEYTIEPLTPWVQAKQFDYPICFIDTVETNSKVNRIGLVHFNKETRLCTGLNEEVTDELRSCSFDKFVLEPKPEYLVLRADGEHLTNGKQDLPTDLNISRSRSQLKNKFKYVHQATEGRHFIALRLLNQCNGCFNRKHIKSIFQFLGRFEMLCGKDLNGTIQEKMLELLETPFLRQMAKLKYHASILPREIFSPLMPMISKIAESTLPRPFDLLTLNELKQLVLAPRGVNENIFLRSFMPLIKREARYRLFLGRLCDYALQTFGEKKARRFLSIPGMLLRGRPLKGFVIGTSDIPLDVLLYLTTFISINDTPKRLLPLRNANCNFL